MPSGPFGIVVDLLAPLAEGLQLPPYGLIDLLELDILGHQIVDVGRFGCLVGAGGCSWAGSLGLGLRLSLVGLPGPAPVLLDGRWDGILVELGADGLVEPLVAVGDFRHGIVAPLPKAYGRRSFLLRRLAAGVDLEGRRLRRLHILLWLCLALLVIFLRDVVER